MYIKLTNKATRGIGLRSMSTKELKRYEAGDTLKVDDNIALGLINSGLAAEIKETEDEVNNDSDAGYDEMTNKELAELLKEQGKSTRGTKEELIARLTEE